MNDPYLYPDCAVLKNKQGIKDDEKLQRIEVDISCNAIRKLDVSPLPGNYNFNHFCEFHKHIFSDVYEWAGQPRTIPMEKAEPKLAGMSIEYSRPENIKSDATAVLDKAKDVGWGNITIDEQAKEWANTLAMLWKVHSFREGNTRTTVTFMCHFAESQGLPIDRELFEKNAEYMRNTLVMASAFYEDGTDFRKSEYLFEIARDSLERGKK